MGRAGVPLRDPDGHIVELYYETEWYQPPPELKPALKNRRSGFPRAASTSAARPPQLPRVDIKANALFFENYLGLRTPSRSCSTTARSCDVDDDVQQELRLRLYRDHYGKPAASITSPMRSTAARNLARRRYLLENGVHIETATQARDPADLLPLCLRARRNRVEVATPAHG